MLGAIVNMTWFTVNIAVKYFVKNVKKNGRLAHGITMIILGIKLRTLYQKTIINVRIIINERSVRRADK